VGRKREREEEISGEIVRETLYLGGVRKQEYILPVLKVPRQCPLVLLVEAARMIGIRFFIIISTVACGAIGADQTENAAFQLVHWRVRNLLPSNGRCLQINYLATYL
jgi:hypothetical protein